MNRYENPYSSDHTTASNNIIISDLHKNIIRLTNEINNLKQHNSELKMVSKTFTITAESYDSTFKRITLNSLDDGIFESIRNSPVCVMKLVTEDTLINFTLYKTLIISNTVFFGSMGKGIQLTKGFLDIEDIEDGIGIIIHDYYTASYSDKQNIQMTIFYLDI